jgi:hypothetical protein
VQLLDLQIPFQHRDVGQIYLIQQQRDNAMPNLKILDEEYRRCSYDAILLMIFTDIS